MGTFSIWHWLIVLVIILLLFGRGRIPKLAGDLARGIKEFKSGMKEEAATPKDVAGTPPTIETGGTAAKEPEKDKTSV